MKDRNENQNRHVANSLRIVGMAQFATFGYPALVIGDVLWILVSALGYIFSEFLSYKVLEGS